MSQGLGQCPVCKKDFTPSDDVVTCPSCGAPYHRACYQKEGHCLFEDKHAAGFEYAAPGADARGAAEKEQNASSGQGEPQGRTQSGGVLCPACQTVNDAHNIFCENCGSPLRAAGPRGAYAGSAGAPGAGPMGYGARYSHAGTIDDIPAGEWAEFIGTSAPSYIQRFTLMEQRQRKTSFMFSAFFLSPYYFAYRKMWGWAAIALVITLVLMLPYMLWITASMGNPLVSFFSVETLRVVATIANYLSLLSQMMFGMLACYLYKTHCAKKIRQLREKVSDDAEYHSQLVRQGNVSVIAVVLAVVVTFAFFMVVINLRAEEFIAYYYPSLPL